MHGHCFFACKARLVPHRLINLRGGKYPAHICHKIFHNLILNRCNLDALAVNRQTFSVRIKHKTARYKPCRGSNHTAEIYITSYLRFNPCNKFERIKRLSHIIVCAEAKTCNFVRILTLCRKKNNRKIIFFPNLQCCFKSVKARHHNIKHNAVNFVILHLFKCILTVNRRNNIKSCIIKINP